jgi:hypothetical protein
MNKLKELEQELVNVNSYVKHYKEKKKNKKLKYWKTIQKYVFKKYTTQYLLKML